MTKLAIFATGALLVSTSAFAQGAPQEQTAEDLVCQLAESCVVGDDESGEVSGEVVEQEPEVAQPAPVPGARVSATRGFKIANKVTAAPPAKPAGTQAAPGAKPRAKVAATPAKRPASPGKGVKAAAMVKSAAAVKNPASGRADLRVSFVTGSAELTEYGQREAMKFAEALKSPLLSGMRFRIEGHTDAVGNRDYNLDLSRRRAQAVVDYLAGKGADRTRFDAVGYGFDKPLAGTSPSAAVNRRVEVVRIK